MLFTLNETLRPIYTLHGLAPQYTSLNFACQSRTLLVAANSALPCSRGLVHFPRHNMTNGRRAFSYAGPHACRNLLPENVRKSTIYSHLRDLSKDIFIRAADYAVSASGTI